jgi:hypothetical protein
MPSFTGACVMPAPGRTEITISGRSLRQSARAKMGENVALTYDVPDDQVLTYKIFPEKGALMTMDTIGRQLTLLSKILCCGDKDDPRKLKALLQCIDTHADGSIAFTIIVAPKTSPDTSGNHKSET